MALSELAAAFARGINVDGQPDAKQLVDALAKAVARGGKENNCGKQTLEAAQQCYKVVQQRLVQISAGSDHAGSLMQLAAVGRASLAAMAALGPPASASQLAAWRYNFARRLVSCKAFADAQAEAWSLFQQLSRQGAAGGSSGKKSSGPTTMTADTANMMVGTCLTLVLCYVEGKLFGSDGALRGVLAAAESLPTWLRQLAASEAAKHGEAAHKYLYKAAVLLLERQAWQQLTAVCSALLAAAGEDGAAQQRALHTVGKLAGHLAEGRAAELLAAVVARSRSAMLSQAAALDMLGLLCSAVQRTMTAEAGQQLRQAILVCCAAAGDSSIEPLQAASLLLPAVVVQSASSTPITAASWVQPVSAAVHLATSAIQQAEEQLQERAPPQPLGSTEQQAAMLEAAFAAANAVRRVLAVHLDRAKGGSASTLDVVHRLGGAEAASLAASVLELLCGVVGVCSRMSGAGCASVAHLGSQGHAAAVGLVTAARLRAACLLDQQGSGSSGSGMELVCSRQAVGWLLGWDFVAYCAGSGSLLPASCAVEPQELTWVASALFNIGVDLHAGEQYAVAVGAMQAAVSMAAVGLAGLEVDAADEDASRLSDFCRKAVALAETQQRAGSPHLALDSLAHCVALMLQLGFEETAAWQPLVHAFVRLQAEQPQPASQPQQNRTAYASSRGSRGAGGRKGGAPQLHASTNASSGGSQPAASTLSGILLRREADLPRGSMAVVAEQELACWAAHPGSSSSAAWMQRVVDSLLADVFPGGQCPLEHAGVLLALHQLGLPAQPEGHLLEKAIQAVQNVSGGAAACMLARAHCLLTLDSARQLAGQALLEQQQERQRSHAAASTSAAGSREQDAAAMADLEKSSRQADEAAWGQVAQQAQQALQALRAAGPPTAADAGAMAAWHELLWLLGLHGSHAAMSELRGLLPHLQPDAEGVLAACLFPAAHGSTAAELQQQAEEAALSLAGRSGSAAVQRASLHRQAAEAFAAAGDMVPALYHASESHRLLAALFHDDSAPGPTNPGGSRSDAAPAVGWWQLAALHGGTLLQLGRLFEATGLADEALHALREGQRLALALGSCPMAATFAASLADIHCKQGQHEAACQAVALAEQQLSGLQTDGCLALEYCRAWVQVVAAQVGLAPYSSSGQVSKAARNACQTALASCAELAASAEEEASSQQLAALGWCRGLHAAALLTAAQAAVQQQDRAATLEHAQASLAAAAADGSCSCSMLRCQQAAALLFLGQHSGPQTPAEPQLALWGLKQAGSTGCDADVPAPARGKSRKAPAKQPAGRSRGKASAAGEEDGEAAGAGRVGAPAGLAPHQQQLWRALELSQGLVCIHRAAASLLAEECGAAGHLHLAAWLLHSSLGAAMRLQYQLVLHSRRQQLLQRQRRSAAAGGAADGGSDVGEQAERLGKLEASVLGPGLDWQLLQQLAGRAGSPACLQAAPAPTVRGRRNAAAAQAPVGGGGDPAAILAALEQQARQQLLAWQAALPPGTATCSISALPGSNGGSLLICRLAPADSSSVAEVLQPQPPLLLALPVQQLSASLSQHPIRALRLDEGDEEAGSSSSFHVSSVHSVLDEMQAVLDQSGRSMREMSTDTREQQREWWRARLCLDDRLAALVRHLDASWLGPWRCMLLGAGQDEAAGSPGKAAADCVVNLLEAAGRPATAQQAAILQHAAAVLARHASSGGMTAGEQRQAAQQLCRAAGLECSQEEVQQLAPLLRAPDVQALSKEQGPPPAAAGAGAADAAAAAPAAGGGQGRRAAGRSVKFADQVEQAAPQRQQQEDAELAAATEPEATPARTSKGRRAAPSRARRGAAAALAAAAAANEDATTGADVSPVATLAAAGSSSLDGAQEPPATIPQGGLSQVFAGLSLEDGPAPGTAAATATAAAPGTAARSGKHRSRLRLMQASTPGPGTARKPRAAALVAAATAPRPARELPLTVAKTAPPAARRGADDADSAAEAVGPVLLVLDGALQALPWESAPGLLRQRLYRMPSLACAAATAQRATASVDLSSTFYALNPSGDLEATQATFQGWFGAMRGWEGKAGSPPSAAELAAALQSRHFFLYCGHGGGEQYISAAKLRSLERCSAALLMGCSSGRLRVQQHYEPAGAVLAYLLAGCPTAVANLWDVTDKDIDRFSQALLTRWISSGGDAGSSAAGSREACSSRAGSSSGRAVESSDAAERGGSDTSAAVAASRAACKLPHLVGAAPVCYGIPSQVYFAGPTSDAQ